MRSRAAALDAWLDRRFVTQLRHLHIDNHRPPDTNLNIRIATPSLSMNTAQAAPRFVTLSFGPIRGASGECRFNRIVEIVAQCQAKRIAEQRIIVDDNDAVGGHSQSKHVRNADQIDAEH
jgi:hypothetical protein